MAQFQLPYGDAFLVSTPAMDRAQQQLHQEQQQREAIGYRDYQRTQDMLQKEFANVRSADIPDLMKSYGDYKNVRQSLLFDKKLHANPVAYAQAQQLANQKLSDIYHLISASKETKDFDEGLSKDMVAHRDEYSTDAGTTHMGWLQMPTKDRVANGFMTPQPLLYQGTNSDFSSLEKNATGDLKEYQGTTQLTPDKLQYIDRNYVRGNNPLQYAETFMDGLNKRQGGQDAALLYKQIPNEQKVAIEQAVQNASDEDLKKWGMTRDQLGRLSQANTPSNAGKYAMFKAQQYFLNNLPQLGKPTYRNNEGELENLKQKDRLTLEGVRQAGRKALKDYSEWYKKKNAALQGEFIDNYYNGLFDDAKKNPKDYNTPQGKVNTYEITASPDLKKLFQTPDGAGHYIQPDRIRFLDNGDVLPIFFKYENNTKVTKGMPKGHAVVNEELSVPMPKQEFKIRVGKQLLGQKEANSEVVGDDEGDGESGGFRMNTSTPSNSVPDFLKKK